MWTETTFNLTRREMRISRPFGDVIAAIEARAPVVVAEGIHELLGRDAVAAIEAGQLEREEARRRVEGRLGSSGFLLLMKIELDLLMNDAGRKRRSVQYAIANPLVGKDISDLAPKGCLYTPLRIAVMEDEKDGSTWVLYDDPESLLGSFGSAPLRKMGNSVNQKLTALVEGAAG